MGRLGEMPRPCLLLALGAVLAGAGCGEEGDGSGLCAIDEVIEGALPLEVPVGETPMAAAPGECGPGEPDAVVFDWTAPETDAYEVLAQLPAGAKLIVQRTCQDDIPACVVGGGVETALGFSMTQGQHLRLALAGCNDDCEVRIRVEP